MVAIVVQRLCQTLVLRAETLSLPDGSRVERFGFDILPLAIEMALDKMPFTQKA